MRSDRVVIALASLALLSAAVVACGAPKGRSAVGGESAREGVGSEPPIAKLWRARCGACHVRVEPRSRSRAVIDAALSRHRKRVRLTEEQWAQLADFLAPVEP